MKDNLHQALTQKTLTARIEFIENNQQLRSPEHRNLATEFINNFKPTSNEWYNIVVVELAEELAVIDGPLIELFVGYLKSPNHYLFKLAVLDYLESTAHQVFDFDLLLPLLDKNGDRMIVQNFARLLLLWQQPMQKEFHYHQLTKQLKRTSDYRSHIRTYCFIQSHPDILTREELNTLLNISEQMELGRGVDTTIEKLKKR